LQRKKRGDGGRGRTGGTGKRPLFLEKRGVGKPPKGEKLEKALHVRKNPRGRRDGSSPAITQRRGGNIILTAGGGETHSCVWKGA